MWVAGACSLVGLGLTWSLLPEPKGLDLEEASRDRAFGDLKQQPAMQPATA